MTHFQMLLVGLGALLIIAVCIITFRRHQLNKLREPFDELFKRYQKRLDRLHAGRDELDLLFNVQPLVDDGTARNLLRSAIRTELVGLRSHMDHVDQHLKDCQRLSSEATWLHKDQLPEASRRLEWEELFRFESPGTQQSLRRFSNTHHLCDFMPQLESRFAAAADRLEMLELPIDMLFPTKGLEDLFVQVDQTKIPRRALCRHPLFRDDRVDTSVYASLETLRRDEPKAFIKRLADYREGENTLHRWVRELVSTVIDLDKLRAAFDDKFPPAVIAIALQACPLPLHCPDDQDKVFIENLADASSKEELIRIVEDATEFYRVYEQELILPARLLLAELESHYQKTTARCINVDAIFCSTDRDTATEITFGHYSARAETALNLSNKHLSSAREHLKYLQLRGVFEDGQKAQAFLNQTDKAYALAEKACGVAVPTDTQNP